MQELDVRYFSEMRKMYKRYFSFKNKVIMRIQEVLERRSISYGYL
jgi:hypothetical protein